jgi:hypothetical protein
MAIVSTLAVASARVWWVVAYWTPRASTFRGRTRALELGVEWDRARECAADDGWRRQVERDIATSAVVVPMTADLLADAVERGVRVSRRWRRRHRRAIARLRPQSSELRPTSNAVAGRRRALARAVPVVAALALGFVAGPTVQQAVSRSHTAAAQPGAATRDFRYHCSQCTPGARGGGFLTAQGSKAPVVYGMQLGTQPGSVPTSVLLESQKRAAVRNSSSR